MYTDNLKYARDRLNETIVRVKDKPFYVRGVGEPTVIGAEFNVVGSFLDDIDTYKEVEITHLNLDPVPLGYVNYKNSSYYLTRKPARMWKQGLKRDNMVFIGEEGFRQFPFLEINNTISGKFPTFEEAVALIKKGKKRVAFHRDFAIGDDKIVYYKSRPVGTYDCLITLSERYKYLQEYINEVMDGKHH